jgi:hypothetical protein
VLPSTNSGIGSDIGTKNKYHGLLADPPEIGISKTSEGVDKKKVVVAFFHNCLRMQKAPIKFTEFGRWDVALVCGPGSRKHPPLWLGWACLAKKV